MMQKKPNPELAQASIDSQPPVIVYKPHPTEKNMIQKFYPTFKINDVAQRIIEHGEPQATYRVCNKGETAEINVYSHEAQKILGYVSVK